MADNERLSRIVTQWSVLQKTYEGPAEVMRSAQQELLTCYGGAVRRYLLAALRSADAADEVFQEFALRFVRGDFHTANPDRGRFRDFLKAVVYRLVVDYQRRQGRAARIAPLTIDAADREDDSSGGDESFAQSWREELLARAWEDLRGTSEDQQKPFYAVLRARVEHPELRSPDLAEKLSQQLGRTVSAGNLRVLLHRARHDFACCLLDQVVHSLSTPSRDELERELIELDLHRYCRDTLQTWPEA